MDIDDPIDWNKGGRVIDMETRGVFMTEVDSEVNAWFRAHDEYHLASETYNKRLELVRAERDRDNWTMNVFQEYAALNDAQRAALEADETFYQWLKGRGGLDGITRGVD